MDQWIYDGKPVTGTEPFFQDAKAFVYIIRNQKTGRSYIGKKRLQFTTHKRKRNRKTRIKVVKQSDWATYWGSSDELKSDIAKLGTKCFSREILRFCRSLSDANYHELREQMIKDVLLYPDLYYNAYVGSRISRKQLGIKEKVKHE